MKVCIFIYRNEYIILTEAEHEYSPCEYKVQVGFGYYIKKTELYHQLNY